LGWVGGSEGGLKRECIQESGVSIQNNAKC